MSKIIILSDDDNLLLKLFEKLDSDFVNNVTHILALKNNKSDLTKVFKNSKIITRDEYTKGKQTKSFNAFDIQEMNNFLKIEQIFYRMLDFTDPDKNFNIHETRKIYYSLLFYMHDLLEETKPDLVFFTGMPHSPHDYILSALAELKKIPILYLRETNIPKLFCFSKTVTGSNNILKNYKISNTKDIQNTENILNNYIDTIKNEKRGKRFKIYSRWRDHSIIHGLTSRLNFKVGYLIFKLIRFVIFIKSCLKDFLKFTYLLLIGKIKNINSFKDFYFISDSFKSKKNSYENSKTNILELNKIIYKNDLKKFKLFKEYKKNSTSYKSSDSYIFFPLHYQPEATNYPHGDVFIDQILALKMLSSHLPEKLKILVKEHPDTFNLSREAWIRGMFNRSFDFYSDLKTIPNLQIIPMNTDMNEVIDNSLAVASLTGSTCLEAVIRSKPGIIFGYPWYEGCKHIYPARTHEECKKALENIRNQVVEEDIKNFFREISHRLFISKKVDIVGEQKYLDSDNEFKIMAEFFKNEIKSLQ